MLVCYCVCLLCVLVTCACRLYQWRCEQARLECVAKVSNMSWVNLFLLFVRKERTNVGCILRSSNPKLKNASLHFFYSINIYGMTTGSQQVEIILFAHCVRFQSSLHFRLGSPLISASTVPHRKWYYVCLPVLNVCAQIRVWSCLVTDNFVYWCFCM